MIAIDQYGQTHKIAGKHPRKELLEVFGKKKAEKMYRDNQDGSSKHIGYVIDDCWLAIYELKEVEL